MLLRVFVGGALQPKLLDLDDGALQQLVREELQDLIGLSREPIFADVVRWNDAMPQYHVGHLQMVAAIDERRAALAELRPRRQCLSRRRHSVLHQERGRCCGKGVGVAWSPFAPRKDVLSRSERRRRAHSRSCRSPSVSIVNPLDANDLQRRAIEVVDHDRHRGLPVMPGDQRVRLDDVDFGLQERGCCKPAAGAASLRAARCR